MSSLKFTEFGLSEQMQRAIRDLGYEEATPIQSMSIEHIMDGKDVLGQSQTGTGKTAAFGIPCIEMIDPERNDLQALILSPTRELAIQVAEEFKKLLKYKDNIRVVPIYGGQPIDRQIFALKKGAQIVIGTPGRVMDHMRRHTLKMKNVEMVILDEADEMLDMGFREDIETILQGIPEKPQTIMFSATMPRGILELTRNYQKDPVHVRVTPKEQLTVPSIYQAYYEVREHNKLEALSRLIDVHDPQLSLIFCNTKKKVDEVVEQLQARGYFAEGLHGDLKQIQRDVVMKKFRNGTLEILVATDVAARGIDVDDIDIVFNYDLPQDEEYYVHRIGRTGRAGKSGMAFTFVVGREIYKVRDIMAHTGAKIVRGKLPSLSDIEEARSKAYSDMVRKIVTSGELSKYTAMIERMMNDYDLNTIDIAAALLKNHMADKEINRPEGDFDDNYSYSRETKEKSKKLFSRDKSRERDKDKDSRDLVRLFFNIGTNNKVMKKDFVGAIANETGFPSKILGNIDMFDDFTFIDVPNKYAKEIVRKMKSVRIRGIKVNVEIAKKKSKSFL